MSESFRQAAYSTCVLSLTRALSPDPKIVESFIQYDKVITSWSTMVVAFPDWLVVGQLNVDWRWTERCQSWTRVDIQWSLGLASW